MDDRANLHVLEGTEEEKRTKALERGLVRVPDEEADAVNAMSAGQRKAWLMNHLMKVDNEYTREARRRLRNKMKARRRNQRRARRANR